MKKAELENPDIKSQLASYIDHTLLKPDTSPEAILKLCGEARQLNCKAVCVSPYYTQTAHRLLGESGVKVATVIGFPMGYTTTSAKAEEIKRAFIDGADEVDVVVNLNAVKNNDWNYVRNDIDTMARMADMRNKVLKVIFEVELLTEAEILQLCDICVDNQVHFVKTATGINGKGNSPQTIKMLRDYLPASIKVKASGGIRNQAEALALLEAGASRLGCSRSLQIINGES